MIKDLLLGRNYPDAGRVLYDNLVSCIDDNDKMVLDMTDVDALPSMFLNTSIGQYISNFGYDRLRGNLSFINITKSQVEYIKDYIVRMA